MTKTMAVNSASTSLTTIIDELKAASAASDWKTVAEMNNCLVNRVSAVLELLGEDELAELQGLLRELHVVVTELQQQCLQERETLGGELVQFSGARRAAHGYLHVSQT